MPGIIEYVEVRLRICMSSECRAPESKRPKYFAGGMNVWLYEAERQALPTESSVKSQPEERAVSD
jgi:hypothetical protein